LFADGVDAEWVAPTVALIPTLGIWVRFVPAGDSSDAAILEASLCSCGELRCVHRVMAVLAARTSLPDSRIAPVPGWSELASRVRDICAELLGNGLDSVPAELSDALSALSQGARTAGVHAAADDLDWLDEQLDAYLGRAARFSPSLWL